MSERRFQDVWIGRCAAAERIKDEHARACARHHPSWMVNRQGGMVQDGAALTIDLKLSLVNRQALIGAAHESLAGTTLKFSQIQQVRQLSGVLQTNRAGWGALRIWQAKTVARPD